VNIRTITEQFDFLQTDQAELPPELLSQLSAYFMRALQRVPGWCRSKRVCM
jgi:hypothetical protein